MVELSILRTELLTDPVALGYAGQTDTVAANTLNSLTTGRTLPRTRIDTTEILGAIADAAWPAVSSLSESKLRAILGMPSVDASSTNIRALFGSIFPTGGQTGATRTALLALSTTTVSRAQEIGLGPVTARDVTAARSGVW